MEELPIGEIKPNKLEKPNIKINQRIRDHLIDQFTIKEHNWDTTFNNGPWIKDEQQLGTRITKILSDKNNPDIFAEKNSYTSKDTGLTETLSYTFRLLEPDCLITVRTNSPDNPKYEKINFIYQDQKDNNKPHVFSSFQEVSQFTSPEEFEKIKGDFMITDEMLTSKEEPSHFTPLNNLLKFFRGK